MMAGNDGEQRPSSVGTDNPISILDYSPPNVIEVNADGVVLPIAHQNGLTVVIPVWPNPAPVGEANELYIFLNGGEVFHQTYTSPLDPLGYRPIIIPAFFAADGIYVLHYETVTEGNRGYSTVRTLTVRRTPVVRLLAPKFPDATVRGYLTCDTKPALWERVLVDVKVPDLIQWQENDELHLEWLGYATLNAEGPLVCSCALVRTLSAQDVVTGYTFSITDYKNCVRPLERNASAKVTYSLFRDQVLIARSDARVVKFDQIITGEGFCGP